MKSSVVDKGQAQAKLETLKSAASEEDTGSSFMNPIKKKRGRPRKEESDAPVNPMAGGGATTSQVNPEQAIEANKRLVRPVWELVDKAGQKMAETREAAMGPQILETLIDTSAACIHQYLPDMLSTHANLIVLSVTFSSWGMKVYLLRQAKLEELRAQYRMQSEVQAPPVQ